MYIVCWLYFLEFFGKEQNVGKLPPTLALSCEKSTRAFLHFSNPTTYCGSKRRKIHARKQIQGISNLDFTSHSYLENNNNNALTLLHRLPTLIDEYLQARNQSYRQDPKLKIKFSKILILSFVNG